MGVLTTTHSSPGDASDGQSLVLRVPVWFFKRRVRCTSRVEKVPNPTGTDDHGQNVCLNFWWEAHFLDSWLVHEPLIIITVSRTRNGASQLLFLSYGIYRHEGLKNNNSTPINRQMGYDDTLLIAPAQWPRNLDCEVQ